MLLNKKNKKCDCVHSYLVTRCKLRVRVLREIMSYDAISFFKLWINRVPVEPIICF